MGRLLTRVPSSIIKGKVPLLTTKSIRIDFTDRREPGDKEVEKTLFFGFFGFFRINALLVVSSYSSVVMQLQICTLNSEL